MANGLTYARKTASTEATKQLAETLAPYLHPGDVVVLSGDLGAGKTQFVQGVAAGLGISAQVTSPTFNILLEYYQGRIPLYHFDLYRLDDQDELEDTGYYDTIDADGVSFIEWGEKFPGALPYGYLEIRILWRRTAAAACSRMRWETAPVSCSPCGQTTRRRACRRPRPAPAASSCQGAPP